MRGLIHGGRSKWITAKLQGELQEFVPEVGAIPTENEER